MQTSKDIAIEQKQKSQWHYEHCSIEHERNEIPAAWCQEHLVDVTECLPEPIEPDAYDNSEENEGYASTKDYEESSGINAN